MSKHRKLLLGFVLLTIALFAYSVVKSAISTAQPVLQLVFGSRNCPVDGLGGVNFVSKGYNRASVAVDRPNTQFYVFTTKQNPVDKEPVTHILTIDSSNIRQTVPLRRYDGRLMRSLLYFLSVNSTGHHWWTAQTPYESVVDSKEHHTTAQTFHESAVDSKGYSTNAILSVHDESGKSLQEWAMTQSIADVLLVQAVGENGAYVITGDHRLWSYTIGQKQPQELSLPQIYTTAAAFATPQGQFVGFQADSDGQVKAFVTNLDDSSHLITTFQWLPKGSFPSLFWYEPQSGLFVYDYLKDENDNVRQDRAKAVYRITPNGTVRKLFETPDVLQTKAGQQVRAGQLLKADEKFVWMEVTYLKDGKTTEYQIVKVPIQ